MNRAAHSNTPSSGGMVSFFASVFMAFFFGFMVLTGYSLLLWVTHGKAYALKHALFHLYSEAQSSKTLESAVSTCSPQQAIDALLVHCRQWFHKGASYLSTSFAPLVDEATKEGVMNSLNGLDAFSAEWEIPQAMGALKLFGEILVLNAEIVMCKAVVLIFSLPLFLAFAWLGLTDGLNHRAIRKAELGRESSYVFHRLSHYLTLTLVFALGIWVALPFNLHHEFVFIPAALLLGFMILQTASRFKKHL